VQLSVVIVDDSRAFLAAAAQMLSGEGLEVCSAVARSDEALAAIERFTPTLALIDVNLHEEDGFDVAQRVIEQYPRVRVVMISSRSEATYSARLAAMPGIRGFLAKDELCAESLTRLA
jgi:DNA-binding NarL/FixJ family response regulator